MTVQIKLELQTPQRGPKCDGCDHIRYSAPGGQAWNRQPHSRCMHFNADIPMVVDARGIWLRSEIPAECPRHRNIQGRLL